MYLIGIDIGGMSAKIGLVSNGKIIAHKKVKTVKETETFFDDISNAVNALLMENNIDKLQVKGVGVGCPGAITAATGVVEFANNLGWSKVPLGKELSDRLNLPVKITNDANAAALGETKFGGGKNFNTTITVTLGTGVGGGIVIDGKLYEGGESKGAEIGHTTLILGGEKCTCGRVGCAEAYVSATALVRDTKRAMVEDKTSLMWQTVGGDINAVDGTTACECAKKGDKTAIKVYDRYAFYLAEYFMNLFNIFRPDALIVGGGICNHGDYLLDKVKRLCEESFYGYKGAPKVEIVTATLGNDAGILGAAALI